MSRADFQITAEHSQAMADMLEDRIIRLRAEIEIATAAPSQPVGAEPPAQTEQTPVLRTEPASYLQPERQWEQDQRMIAGQASHLTGVP